MNYLLSNFGRVLVALTAIGIAGWLAFDHAPGWGWFLFVGFLCAGYLPYKAPQE